MGGLELDAGSSLSPCNLSSPMTSHRPGTHAFPSLLNPGSARGSGCADAGGCQKPATSRPWSCAHFFGGSTTVLREVAASRCAGFELFRFCNPTVRSTELSRTGGGSSPNSQSLKHQKLIPSGWLNFGRYTIRTYKKRRQNFRNS